MQSCTPAVHIKRTLSFESVHALHFTNLTNPQIFSLFFEISTNQTNFDEDCKQEVSVKYDGIIAHTIDFDIIAS